uniref:Uncharacterized protein n=1 Tax=Arundo donax TaxID=35708 RepID=A0A0A9BVZ9_ARUDO
MPAVRELRRQGPAPARRAAPGGGEGGVGGVLDGILPVVEAHATRCNTGLPET